MTWESAGGGESERRKSDGGRVRGNKEDADMNNSVVMTSPLQLPLSCLVNPKQEKSFKTPNQSNES